MGNIVRSSAGILTAVLSMLGAGSALGAVITWNSAADISGDSDVSTNGALVAAFNFAGSDTTVNTVAFKAFAIPPSPLPNDLLTDVHTVTVDSFYTLAVTPERAGHFLTSFNTSSGLAPFNSLSGDYRSLLGSAAGSSFADRTTTLTIGNLTIGQTYQFQAWVNDSTISGCCSYGVSLDGQDLNPNVLEDLNGDVVEGGTGQYIIGTFTADASSQQLEFLRGEIPGGLNGFQLRAATAANVPAPATAALLSLGLLGIGWSRVRFGRRGSSDLALRA